MKRRQFLAAAIAVAATSKITLTLLSKDSKVQLWLLHAETFNQRIAGVGEVTYAHILFRDELGQDEWLECTTRAGEDALRELSKGFDVWLMRRYGAQYGFRNFSHCKREILC